MTPLVHRGRDRDNHNEITMKSLWDHGENTVVEATVRDCLLILNYFRDILVGEGPAIGVILCCQCAPLLSHSCPTLVPLLSHSCPTLVPLLSHSASLDPLCLYSLEYRQQNLIVISLLHLYLTFLILSCAVSRCFLILLPTHSLLSSISSLTIKIVPTAS